MASRKRGLLSGGAKNPKKPSTGTSTQLTLTSSILKSQPVSTSSSRRHDSPDLFDADDNGDVEILEPTPKRRQLRSADTQAVSSVSSGVSTRTRQRSSQMSTAMPPPTTSAASRSTAATQRSAGSFFTPREKPTPTKRRPTAEPDDTVYQSVKKPKTSSPVPETDGLEVVMKLRSHPPTKTFQKAAQGSHRGGHASVSQPILCSQMSTWSISS